MKLKIMYSIFIVLASVLFIIKCTPTQKVVVSEKTPEIVITPPVTEKLIPAIKYIPDSITQITINLVGDLMCHLPQTKNAETTKGVYDFKPSFEYIKPYLQNADLTIGNLETTFAGTQQPYAGYPAFNSPDAYCEAIKDAGFDFLVTANNHSMDTKEAGLLRTVEIIKKNNLGYAGTYLSQADHDSVRILNIKGIKLGILNYTYGTNGSYPSTNHQYMLNVIDSAGITDAVLNCKKKGADAILVFYHMGLENVVEPTQAQKDAVRFALNAGANFIIGAHPHVVGPTTTQFSKAINDSVFIAYSLGNFLSNQYWRYTDAGVILKLTVEKNFTTNHTKYKNASFMPTWVYRGDGAKKMHIVFPAQLYNDTTKLPSFINLTHQQKMEEAFNDTYRIITKYNPIILIENLEKNN